MIQENKKIFVSYGLCFDWSKTTIKIYSFKNSRNEKEIVDRIQKYDLW